MGEPTRRSVRISISHVWCIGMIFSSHQTLTWTMLSTNCGYMDSKQNQRKNSLSQTWGQGNPQNFFWDYNSTELTRKYFGRDQKWKPSNRKPVRTSQARWEERPVATFPALVQFGRRSICSGPYWGAMSMVIGKTNCQINIGHCGN